MNKLILVGNGFDLAHGLPTSYTDFLNNFWKTFPTKFKDDFIKDIIQSDESYFEYFNYRGNSIKSFKDGTDNYIDIVQNISRHFKDKPAMRRKIVNKEFSSPLLQNVRFKKIEKN